MKTFDCRRALLNRDVVNKLSLCAALVGAITACATNAKAGGIGASTAVLFDNSGSTIDIKPFIGSTFSGLSQKLTSGGIDSLYGLITFRSNYINGANVPENIVSTFSGGSLFGTGSDFQAAANKVINTGGSVDGVQAIEHALTRAGYVSQFQTGNARYVMLVTDTYREITLSSLSSDGLSSLLASNNTKLSALVNASFYAADGSRLAAIFKDKSGAIVGYRTDGSSTIVPYGRTVVSVLPSNSSLTRLTQTNFEEVQKFYVNVALNSGGVVGDVTLLGQGGTLETALANALTAALIQTVVGPLVPEITKRALDQSQTTAMR